MPRERLPGPVTHGGDRALVVVRHLATRTRGRLSRRRGPRHPLLLARPGELLLRRDWGGASTESTGRLPRGSRERRVHLSGAWGVRPLREPGPRAGDRIDIDADLRIPVHRSGRVRALSTSIAAQRDWGHVPESGCRWSGLALRSWRGSRNRVRPAACLSAGPPFVLRAAHSVGSRQSCGRPVLGPRCSAGGGRRAGSGL